MDFRGIERNFNNTINSINISINEVASSLSSLCSSVKKNVMNSINKNNLIDSSGQVLPKNKPNIQQLAVNINALKELHKGVSTSKAEFIDDTTRGESLKAPKNLKEQNDLSEKNNVQQMELSFGSEENVGSKNSTLINEKSQSEKKINQNISDNKTIESSSSSESEEYSGKMNYSTFVNEKSLPSEKKINHNISDNKTIESSSSSESGEYSGKMNYSTFVNEKSLPSEKKINQNISDNKTIESSSSSESEEYRGKMNYNTFVNKKSKNISDNKTSESSSSGVYGNFESKETTETSESTESTESSQSSDSSIENNILSSNVFDNKLYNKHSSIDNNIKNLIINVGCLNAKQNINYTGHSETLEKVLDLSSKNNLTVDQLSSGAFKTTKRVDSIAISLINIKVNIITEEENNISGEKSNFDKKIIKNNSEPKFNLKAFKETSNRYEAQIASSIFSKKLENVVPGGAFINNKTGDIHFVTKFCNQGTIASAWSEMAIKEKKLAITDLAKGIQEFHQNGFSWGDCHGGNILVNKEKWIDSNGEERSYKVYLSDFGTARKINQEYNPALACNTFIMGPNTENEYMKHAREFNTVNKVLIEKKSTMNVMLERGEDATEIMNEINDLQVKANTSNKEIVKIMDDISRDFDGLAIEICRLARQGKENLEFKPDFSSKSTIQQFLNWRNEKNLEKGRELAMKFVEDSFDGESPLKDLVMKQLKLDQSNNGVAETIGVQQTMGFMSGEGTDIIENPPFDFYDELSKITDDDYKKVFK
ncbi:MAG: hypothetical protein H0V82_06825 [Candidatus Protochlamydia sp.]|nr:hypothetical protein [Candidatus Protochlamydia sp.]